MSERSPPLRASFALLSPKWHLRNSDETLLLLMRRGEFSDDNSSSTYGRAMVAVCRTSSASGCRIRPRSSPSFHAENLKQFNLELENVTVMVHDWGGSVTSTSFSSRNPSRSGG